MEKMKLYWVTTQDHGEDWFVVANSSEEASEFHENSEGYDQNTACAEEILTIPASYSPEIGWPSDELLISVGAKFISNESTRIVEIDNRTFCEGLLEAIISERHDDLFEKRGFERLNKTKKPSHNSVPNKSIH